MGNDQSIEKKRIVIAREAQTQALLEKQRKFYEEKCRRLVQQAQASQSANVEAQTQVLLEKQAKFYKENCRRLIEQAQASQTANVVAVEQSHVGSSSAQPMYTLYPDLSIAALQPSSSTSIDNLPSRDSVNNIPRNIASTSIINNNISKNISTPSANNSYLQLGTDVTKTAMPLPSAPPEPSALTQRERRGKGTYPQKNRNVPVEYSCETCGQMLGINIFQCMDGHSSCHVCKKAGRVCGKRNCEKTITDTRNRTVEALMAEMTLDNLVDRQKAPNSRRVHKVNCPNQSVGCKLFFNNKEIADHMKECPFNEMACPLASIFGLCLWRGRINQLVNHFIEHHPEHHQANGDTELTILDIKHPSRIVHLVAFGTFNFLVNIKVDPTSQTYMVVQFFGTTFSASKWNYEFHIYNKSQPRRKYQYADICLSNCVPIEDIFDNNTCAVLPISYFKTFESNGGSINYKFYIKKRVE